VEDNVIHVLRIKTFLDDCRIDREAVRGAKIGQT
jgi:hypothetical protein